MFLQIVDLNMFKGETNRSCNSNPSLQRKTVLLHKEQRTSSLFGALRTVVGRKRAPKDVHHILIPGTCASVALQGDGVISRTCRWEIMLHYPAWSNLITSILKSRESFPAWWEYQCDGGETRTRLDTSGIETGEGGTSLGTWAASRS